MKNIYHKGGRICFNKQTKNGISLIILVITIVIIIILAGAVIVALNNSGVITKAKLAKESSEFTSIREAVELEKQNMLLTGTFDKNKIDIPNTYKDDIEVKETGEILIKYNAATKIIDMANAIKILGASYISNGFDEIQSISGGTASAGETKLAKIIIEGKSEQTVTTQSANLLDNNNWYAFDSLNNSTPMTMPGTTRYAFLMQVLPVGTYTLSCKNSYWFSANRLMQNGVIVNIGVIALPYTFNVTTAGVVGIGIERDNYPIDRSDIYIGVGLTPRDFGMMINSGSTAMPYEPFVPNSPSPDYPSKINSVSNFDLVSSGKNLFNKTTAALNRYIQSDGSVGSSAGWFASDFIAVIPNAQYTVKYTSSSPVVFTCYYDTNKNFVSADTRNFGNLNRVFTIPSTARYMRISSLITNIDDEQVELGTVATPVDSFRGMQTINFPYTLRSLPDGTKDYIEIDNVAKTAKLYKNVGEVILDGTEIFHEEKVDLPNGTQFYIISKPTDVIQTSTKITAISTHFKSGTFESRGTNANSIYTYSGVSSGVRINTTVANTIYDFKSWLSVQNTAGTPVTVQYKLTTPIITDLEYQELQIGYPFTNIYTTSVVKPKIIGQVINK